MLKVSHDTLHQRRLTLAIASHEGYLVASLHGEVHSAKHLLVAECHAHVAHLHGVGAAAWAWWEFESQVAGVFLVHFDELQLLEHLHAALHL